MHNVFLGLGGNIGNLPLNFKKAKESVEERCGKIIRSSSAYKTPPLGFNSDHYFMNQVIEVETDLIPSEIIKEIIEIEKELGRVRSKGKFASRPIDIDILYFDNLIINRENLIVPHPRIAERKFVLVPLVEIAPDFIHPQLQKTNYQLLQECSDSSEIALF